MKMLIPMIFAVCLFVTSCGGEPIENPDYTHYNVATSILETTSSTVDSQVTDKRTSKSETFTTKIADLSNNTDIKTTEKEIFKNTDNSKKTEKTQGSSAENSVGKNNIAVGKNYAKKSVLSKTKDGGNASHSSTVYATSVNNYSEKTENTESVSVEPNFKEPESTTALESLKDTDTGYITDTGTRYHRSGCRYLAKSCIEIIVGEAKEKGYTPCKVCKPQIFCK